MSWRAGVKSGSLRGRRQRGEAYSAAEVEEGGDQGEAEEGGDQGEVAEGGDQGEVEEGGDQSEGGPSSSIWRSCQGPEASGPRSMESPRGGPCTWPCTFLGSGGRRARAGAGPGGGRAGEEWRSAGRSVYCVGSAGGTGRRKGLCVRLTVEKGWWPSLAPARDGEGEAPRNLDQGG